jgi:HSP20 family protein
MSLIRYQAPQLSNWPSFDRLSSLRNDLDRLFDLSWSGRDSGLFSGWSPALDVFDEKDHFVVNAELPGMKKEEIELSFQDGMLSISGERKQSTEKTEGETYRSERYFGKFQRSVTLPTAVDSSKISASYKDGVLSVTLPKSEAAKPKQIQVNVA